MTKNTKSGTLPDTFEEQLQNNPDSALLVADLYLGRDDVLERIAQAVDVDLDSASTGHLDHDDYARLFQAVDGTDRPVRLLKRDHRKATLAQKVADAAGADVDIEDGADGYRKDQAIRVWFALHPATDQDRPTDHDQDQGDQARVQA